jgi:hypothetical protein
MMYLPEMLEHLEEGGKARRSDWPVSRYIKIIDGRFTIIEVKPEGNYITPFSIDGEDVHLQWDAI